MSSLRNRRNWIMVKSFFKTAPKSWFWAPHLCTKNWVLSMIGQLKSRCRFASQVERKFETHWNLLETQNKELVAASQKLITGVKFRLRRILGCVRSLRVVQEIGHFFFHFFFSVYLPWKRSSLSCLCSWSAASHFRRSKRKYLYPWVLEEIVPIRP